MKVFVVLLVLGTLAKTEDVKVYLRADGIADEKADGWMMVEHDVQLKHDLDAAPLQIKTNSTFGSEEKVNVWFRNEQGTSTGGFTLRFSSSLKYFLHRCHISYKTYSDSIPTDDNKVWTIERTTERLTITCNNKRLLTFVFSDVTCDDYAHWKNYWSQNTRGIYFSSKHDTASDYWRARQGGYQIGEDIDGEARGDWFGFSVSLSADGTVLAVGAALSHAGYVRVYSREDNNWAQIGEDIDGEAADDGFGWSVSLSADGTVLAVGAPFNNAGYVRVYRREGNNWVQIGQDIDGKAKRDFSGKSVSLSADGTILAVGAPFDAAGYVRVYSWVGNNWAQIGEDINGRYGFGWSVSLSADGTVLAAGNSRKSYIAGYVRIYSWAGNNWVQIGEDIDGEAAGDSFGSSVSLSADGTVLAVGAWTNDGNGKEAGHVRVFSKEGSNWVQIGEDIDGEAARDYFGTSVSLSADGTVLAVGAFGNDGNGRSAGHVRVYSRDQGNWKQIGKDFDGENVGDSSGWSVCLSGDGVSLAIGAVYNGDKGHVRVFSISPSKEESA